MPKGDRKTPPLLDSSSSPSETVGASSAAPDSICLSTMPKECPEVHEAIFDFNWLCDLPMEKQSSTIGIVEAEHYHKLMRISHQNLRKILDVEYSEAPPVVVYASLVKLPELSDRYQRSYFLSKSQQFHTFNTRYFVSSLVEAINCLHSHDLYHGNVDLSNVFVADGGRRPIYKLGNYKYYPADPTDHVSLIRMKLLDYKCLGKLIDEFISGLTGEESGFDQYFNHYEIRDVVSYLVKGNYSLDQVRKTIYKSAAFFTVADKATSLLKALWIIGDLNLGEGLDSLDMFENNRKLWYEDIPKPLLEYLASVKAFHYKKIPDLMVDGQKVNFGRTLKNTLSHARANRLKMQMGKVICYDENNKQINLDTPQNVFEYFNSLHPKAFFRIWEFAKTTGIKYESPAQILELPDAPPCLVCRGSGTRPRRQWT